MTYRTVFQFDAVTDAYQRDWLPLQKQLKDLATRNP
jgi:hypothetical protein